MNRAKGQTMYFMPSEKKRTVTEKKWEPRNYHQKCTCPTLFPTTHLDWHFSTLSPALHDMFQEIKTGPKHTEPKERHFCIWGQLVTSCK